MDLENLIEGLARPGAYPHPTDGIEVVQTHISVVFLAGDRAYKLKKPLDLGFLDFTTLARRRHFCEEEVRLNRRLAPDVYLGVEPIVRSGDGLVVGGDGEAVEHAVVMRRLPEDRTFESLLAHGALGEPSLRTLAARMARFHEDAASGPEIARFGGFETVAGNARENFEQIAPAVGQTLRAPVFERLRDITEDDLARLRPLIDDRAERGVTRDTHGDLHLKHVYAFPASAPPGDMIVVDCIEFNERFRYADPVADVAFLDMDLRYRGRPDLARAFSDAYFEATGDDEGRALLPYYVGYRAIVRGKVDGFAVGEPEIPADQREAARLRAEAYFMLALGVVSEPAARPCLALSIGLPGTGKSWLARWLASDAGFSIVSTDRVRKGLAGFEATDDASAPVDQGIYGPDWSERTYAACLEEARERLLDGDRVVVDGTFREEGRRQAFVELARALRVPALVFQCEAAPGLVRRRLDARAGDTSDADWGIYEALAERWEPFGPDTAPLVTSIDTGRPDEESLAAVSVALAEAGLA